MSCAARIILLNLLVVGACFVVGMQAASSGELTDPGAGYSTKVGAPAPASLDSPSSSDTPAAGMKIHIDPQTGQLRNEPAGLAPLQLSPSEENSFSTSHSGLVESLSPVPGGGVIVDLQGRFHSPLTATIDDTGKVSIRHLHPTPSTGQTK